MTAGERCALEALPRILYPFDRRECLTLEQAAKTAGKSTSTVRRWCIEHEIGRRVVEGPWGVSRVALQMLLDDNFPALAAWLAGWRGGPLVAPYLIRFGLGEWITDSAPIARADV